MNGLREGFGFPKSLRLLKRREYLRVQTGNKARGNFVTLMHRSAVEPKVRFGVTVSKKVGGAVTRNRIKRRIREILRQSRHRFSNGDYVVIAHPAAAQASYQRLAEDLETARFRLEKFVSSTRRKTRRRKKANPGF